MTADVAGLRAALSAELPGAYDLRRRIHQHPDLGGHEQRTAAIVADAVGVPEAPAVTEGRLVRIDVGTGQAVGVRAELDGLPIVEATGVPWASTNGAMHACGHDVHLAALVALARAVRAVGAPRPLLAIFQPREETYPCGAKDLIESPLLAAEDVGAFLGVHVQPTLPRGVVAAIPGAVNAAADELRIVVVGRPGHAAYPHLTRDPIIAASAVVLALQQLVSRRIDPLHPTVLTIGSIHAGTAANAIPGKAVLTGTMRTFAESDRKELAELVRQTADLTARTYGCTAEVEIALGEPVLDNDPALAAAIAPRLLELGLARDGELRSCGADDFAYYCTVRPSLMAFVGVGEPDGPGLHHPRFLPPDAAVADVAHTMLAGYLAACDILH